MAIIKCKMCGGDIELAADKTFGTCEYCGSTMTLPKVDDEQRAAAFNRGNHFRRIGEFDKALQVYERIVREDDTDAEAHWCCALCRFGIEYVEDPSTLEYLPTCHRVSFDSFLEDVDYLAALEHSDGITKRQYQKDAAKIAEVQRGILATSQNTDPYDVFICYKESDENGDRTRDSLLAQDIYYQLTEQGKKVFFARITLEDVVGKEYEPYIFAALNSAKVMIVVGTKPEYLNAVWVKNEWSRFLAMMKKDHSKLLLPCYRDMDPYDMPEQLSVLQSYDMSKIGFIQDLIRGINKVLDADVPKATVVAEPVVASNNSNVAPLLKRAFIFLEDKDWSSANEYCEKVLDIDPENAEAYLGKLMADLKVSKQENLADCTELFDNNPNYQKAIRFGDDQLKTALACYLANVPYSRATKLMSEARSEANYLKAAELLESLNGYKNSADLAVECREKAEDAKKDDLYRTAKARLKSHTLRVEDCAKSLKEFRMLSGWKDADEQVIACQKKLEELQKKKQAEQAAKDRMFEEYQQTVQKRKIKIVTTAVIIISLIILLICILPVIKGNIATNYLKQGRYENAVAISSELVWPESEEEIPNDAFRGCSELTQIDIPDGVTKIGDYAFHGCTNLTSITIPDSVTYIGEGAFYGCTDLTSITIPDSITDIGDYAFYRCEDLTSITIPDSVEHIGFFAFDGCTSLETVYFESQEQLLRFSYKFHSRYNLVVK